MYTRDFKISIEDEIYIFFLLTIGNNDLFDTVYKK